MFQVGSHLMFNFDLLSPARLAKFNKESDIDVITSTEEEKQYLLSISKNYDVLVHPKVHDLLKNALDKLSISIPVVIQSLKLSHMHYDLSQWHKHCHDIIHMDSLGIKPDMELVYALKAEWTKFYKGKDKIKLNKKPKEFFTASYNQQHDQLHEHFKFMDEPIYKKFLKDGEPVAVDKSKFDLLSHQEQIYSVIEESMVVAYERKLSLLNGFKHVYTNLSKNWWNDFITENFVEIINQINQYQSKYKELKNATIL